MKKDTQEKKKKKRKQFPIKLGKWEIVFLPLEQNKFHNNMALFYSVTLGVYFFRVFILFYRFVLNLWNITLFYSFL